MQGSSVTISSSGQTVDLIYPYGNTDYIVTASGGTAKYGNTCCYTLAEDSFLGWTSDDESFNSGILQWVAHGYVT